jgi:hypothetical protein
LAMILPVRFRAVASGLIMEKVRSTAIASSCSVGEKATGV